LLRKKLVLVAVSILVIQLFTTSVILRTYALASPVYNNVDLKFNFDASVGFQKIVRNADAPEFVLERGATGMLKIDLTSYENGPVIVTLRFGGDDPFVNWGLGTSLPDGITCEIEPDVIELASHSRATATLRIEAASDISIRQYNISVILDLFRGAAPPHSVERQGHPITLTATEDVAPTTTVTGIATLYVNRTITSTSIFSTTQTRISVTTSSLTTTVTSTSTVTSPEQSADALIYVWVVGATAATAVLAVVLLLQRKPRLSRTR
jgi:hypothetical protein